MVVIVFRERTAPAHFLEYLLVPHPASVCLSLPEALPSRYLGRAASFTLPVYGGVSCFQVTSLAAPESQHTTHAGLLSGAGVWVTHDDMTPRGGFAPAGLQPLRHFFGVRIDESSALALSGVDPTLRARARVLVPPPLSLYHGTEESSCASIMGAGLRETFGMLGTGVYLGTFWKAARFACLTQDYQRRHHGCVLRVLAFVTSVRALPQSGWTCGCVRCAGDACAATVSDHLGVWRQQGCDALHALASTDACGVRARDGAPRFLLRNEEWAVRRERLFVTHTARVDEQSFFGARGVFDPLHRGTRIL